MAGDAIVIPEEFARRMRGFGEGSGAAWLERLPAVVARCVERWSLRLGPPFPLSYNYVAPAWRDGEPLVLKLGMPDSGLRREIEALRLGGGRGVVRLIAAEPELGAMLLERLMPGTPLSRLGAERDEEATRIAAEVMRRIWRPAPDEHRFLTLAGRAAGLAELRRRFDGGTGPLPEQLVSLAEALFAELLASSPAPMLLHGDLHHENILAGGREPWLAIDPKGVVGDPAYEAATLLLNPVPDLIAWPRPEGVLSRRLDILAEMLGFERERLWAWGLAHAVLSAWWNIEDFGAGWEYSMQVAELLAGIEDKDG